MFKFSDIKVGDILIASRAGSEYKVLEAERQEDTYYFYVENVQSKTRSSYRMHEGNEAKFGLAKIIHA